MVLRQNPSPDPRSNAALRAGLASPELQEGSVALFLGRAHYGCVATLLPPSAAGLERLVRFAPRPFACPLSLPIPPHGGLGHSPGSPLPVPYIVMQGLVCFRPSLLSVSMLPSAHL